MAGVVSEHTPEPVYDSLVTVNPSEAAALVLAVIVQLSLAAGVTEVDVGVFEASDASSAARLLAALDGVAVNAVVPNAAPMREKAIPILAIADNL
jgi:hypothetical protein